jgi:hypothetical protein|tara:strand:- start:12259 stop:13179 length:921 start_codon:yes stop_codon:yes gene_type:complete
MFPSASATFQPIISEVVNEVDRQQFVGSQILPILMTDTQKGKYIKIVSSQFDNDISKPRAAGSNFAQTSGEYESATFECVEYGVENALDDLNIVEAASDAQLDIVSAAANQLADDLMVGHELRAAAALSGASFTSTAATAAMSVVASATPIADINNAVVRLNQAGIFNNIQLVIEASLYQEMLQTDDMRNLINGSGTLFWSQDQVARVLGVDGVIICKTRYNNALKGQTGSRTDIWPTSSFYVASIASGPLSSGGVGRTMAYSRRGGPFVSETYRTEQPPADVVRVRMNTDELIINVNAGQKITGA